MTFLFISQDNAWMFVLAFSICYSVFQIGPVVRKKMFPTSREVFTELGIQHHGHMFVIKDFSPDYEKVFIERCMPSETQAYYATAKNAHYAHDTNHGPCVKVNCMISQDPGFWTLNYFALKDLKENSLFEISFPSGGTIKFVIVSKEKAVFIDAVNS